MGIFNNLIDFVARILAGLYALPIVGGSYGVAIILLTAAVMVLLMPLTLKATRSTIKMQAFQPELRRIQKEYKDQPRDVVNAEIMKLYQENGINPVGGCIPMVAQLPVFIVLFQVLRGISTRTKDAPFFSLMNDVRAHKGLPPDPGDTITPHFIDHSTQMYRDLSQSTDMAFGPIDLARQAGDVIQGSFLRGLPYVVLILFVVGTSYYQQKQISARRVEGEPSAMNAQQQMLLRFLPLMSGIWSFFFPAGLVLYWATSNVFRIGQQAYITHQIYGKEMAEGGRLSSTIKAAEAKAAATESPKKEQPVKSSGKTKPAGTASKNGSAAGDSASNALDRRAQWEARRQVKAKQKKTVHVSERVTPKGTQPRAAKPKKNRKR